MADDVKAPLGAGAGHDELPIDVELLKVLSSDSRRDILRLLDKRRMTLSELSVALGLKKATVLEHLKKLVEAGLIRRMEDERLWVYYELTHRGGRLVNPGRTRFFLVLGLAAAAAAVLLGVAAMAVTLSGAHDDAAPGRGALHAKVFATQEGLVAGAPVTLRASALAPDGASQIERALLLTQTDARALASSGRLSGIPLVPVEATDGEVELVSRTPVPAGDYYLYVSDASGRDNAGRLPTVRVPALDAVGPAVVWRGLDEGAAFDVHADGAPANGTLLLLASAAPQSERSVATAPVEDGRALFKVATLDALQPGSYAMQLLPESRNGTVPLQARVEVREPRPVVAPLDLPQGSDGLVRVTLAPSADLAPGDVRVLVDGQPAEAERVAPHVLQLRLDTQEPGTRAVQVGRLPPQNVTIHPALRLDLARDENATLRVRAFGAGGAPVANVTLLVDDAPVGATDENGALPLGNLSAGRHVLAFRHRATEAAHVVESDGANLSLVPREVALSVEPPTLTDKDVRLVVTLRDAWPIEAPLVVTARLGGEVVALQRVESGGAQPTLTLALDLPRPGAGEHDLRVQAVPPSLAPLDLRQVRYLAWNGSLQADRDGMQAPTPTAPTSEAHNDAGGWEPSNASGAPAAPTVQADLEFAYYRSSPHEVVVPLSVPGVPRPTVTPTVTGAWQHDAAFGQTAPEVPGPGALLAALALAGVALALRRRGRRD